MQFSSCQGSSLYFQRPAGVQSCLCKAECVKLKDHSSPNWKQAADLRRCAPGTHLRPSGEKCFPYSPLSCINEYAGKRLIPMLHQHQIESIHQSSRPIKVGLVDSGILTDHSIEVMDWIDGGISHRALLN